jgi:hypothetical protein
MAPILTRPTGTSSSKSIDDLLRRRFGTLAPPPVPTLQHPRSEGTQGSQAIAAARTEYEAMTPAQLQGEVEKARREDVEAMKAKAAAEERALFFHQPHAAANSSYWGKMALWTLDEAIALSLGKNPNAVNWSSVNGDGDRYIIEALRNSPFRGEYARRRELANRAEAAHELRDPIKPEAFLTWSLHMFDSTPPELLEQVRATGKYVADLEALTRRVSELQAQVSAGNVVPGKWPWGQYETEYLRTLAEAAERFWVRYDPDDPSSASTSQTVVSWLQKEHGVPQRVAEIMAQILRPAGLRRGPR